MPVSTQSGDAVLDAAPDLAPDNLANGDQSVALPFDIFPDGQDNGAQDEQPGAADTMTVPADEPVDDAEDSAVPRAAMILKTAEPNNKRYDYVHVAYDYTLPADSMLTSETITGPPTPHCPTRNLRPKN